MKYLLIMLISFVSINVLAGEVGVIVNLGDTKPRATSYTGAYVNAKLAGPLTLGLVGTSNNVLAASSGLSLGTTNIASFGLIGGKNISDNSNAFGGYASHNIDGQPLTVGVTVLNNQQNTSYSVTMGYRF